MTRVTNHSSDVLCLLKYGETCWARRLPGKGWEEGGGLGSSCVSVRRRRSLGPGDHRLGPRRADVLAQGGMQRANAETAKRAFAVPRSRFLG